MLQCVTCPLIFASADKLNASEQSPVCSVVIFKYEIGKQAAVAAFAIDILLLVPFAILLHFNQYKKQNLPSHLPCFLSVKYQLNENIHTTKLMFTTVVANIATALYMVPVTLIYGVNIEADAPLPMSSTTMQHVIAYAPWEASIEVQLPVVSIVFTALLLWLSPQFRSTAWRVLLLSRCFPQPNESIRKFGIDEEQQVYFKSLQVAWGDKQYPRPVKIQLKY
ncbi:unnamed protein product [Gongylonema pulchrum]|uniref:G_PROTEIN_RECEP_F1_2 domain-containing protein n=1 Tax=Gongylonema pulchrum TaxID=637853 RepID=A0A183CWA3_9BILA|nr:unnamed protein product [Gongylonema pulchrum]